MVVSYIKIYKEVLFIGEQWWYYKTGYEGKGSWNVWKRREL